MVFDFYQIKYRHRTFPHRISRNALQLTHASLRGTRQTLKAQFLLFPKQLSQSARTTDTLC